MRSAKQIVFRYNGDPTTQEIDLDMDGDKSVPKQGSFVDRKGERWKVVQVNVERSDRALRGPHLWAIRLFSG